MEDKLKAALDFTPAPPPRVTEGMLRRREEARMTRIQLVLLSMLSLLWTVLMGWMGWSLYPYYPVVSIGIAFALSMLLPASGVLATVLVQKERMVWKS